MDKKLISTSTTNHISDKQIENYLTDKQKLELNFRNSYDDVKPRLQRRNLSENHLGPGGTNVRYSIEAGITSQNFFKNPYPKRDTFSSANVINVNRKIQRELFISK